MRVLCDVIDASMCYWMVLQMIFAWDITDVCVGCHWFLPIAVTWISCILQDVWAILVSQMYACHRDVVIAL